MSLETIKAYDLPERVASYDADMNLMHPNRVHMVEIALEVLPFETLQPFLALDLGIGTGFFTQALLRRFPKSRVLAIDGAASMIDLAHVRLGELAERVDFRVGDFRQLASLIGESRGKAVFSSYALHHLNQEEKSSVVQQAVSFLEPGGWFLNADLIRSEDAESEARIQQIRINGIVRRAAGRDTRFVGPESTRRFLEDLEARDHDQPLTLLEDWQVLKSAGLRHVCIYWTEFREAVMGGQK